FLVFGGEDASPLPPFLPSADEKSTAFTSRDPEPLSFGGLPFPNTVVGFSAKKISISATVLLRCSNARILAPRSFSLIFGFRLLWHSFTASSCAGGCSHFMLISRHLLMKSRADSFLFCFRDMSSTKTDSDPEGDLMWWQYQQPPCLLRSEVSREERTALRDLPPPLFLPADEQQQQQRGRPAQQQRRGRPAQQQQRRLGQQRRAGVAAAAGAGSGSEPAAAGDGGWRAWQRRQGPAATASPPLPLLLPLAAGGTRQRHMQTVQPGSTARPRGSNTGPGRLRLAERGEVSLYFSFLYLFGLFPFFFFSFVPPVRSLPEIWHNTMAAERCV
ncbi:hypothetical protein Taro_011854, partial [Colocasia esculenta]|nr:hypothetical protein [Colocasia esculenta]